MPRVRIDKVGEMAIIECTGEFVRAGSALKLRDAVTSQREARVVVLDLTEMNAIGGGGVRMLMRLRRWAENHNIRVKLFNPSGLVRDKLKRDGFEIVTLEQMTSLFRYIDSQPAVRLIESHFPSYQLLHSA
jgi:anti-anti-sigma regulatory factor